MTNIFPSSLINSWRSSRKLLQNHLSINHPMVFQNLSHIKDLNSWVEKFHSIPALNKWSEVDKDHLLQLYLTGAALTFYHILPGPTKTLKIISIQWLRPHVLILMVLPVTHGTLCQGKTGVESSSQTINFTSTPVHMSTEIATDNTFSIKGYLETTTCDFLIDTGASITTRHISVWENLRPQGRTLKSDRFQTCQTA